VHEGLLQIPLLGPELMVMAFWFLVSGNKGRISRNPFCFFRIGRISFFRLSRIHLSFGLSV